jgi:hypothetical protein
MLGAPWAPIVSSVKRRTRAMPPAATTGVSQDRSGRLGREELGREKLDREKRSGRRERAKRTTDAREGIEKGAESTRRKVLRKQNIFVVSIGFINIKAPRER